jgi:hypothetical protein
LKLLTVWARVEQPLYPAFGFQPPSALDNLGGKNKKYIELFSVFLFIIISDIQKGKA